MKKLVTLACLSSVVCLGAVNNNGTFNYMTANSGSIRVLQIPSLAGTNSGLMFVDTNGNVFRTDTTNSSSVPVGVLYADGHVAMTGDLDVGGQNINNVHDIFSDNFLNVNGTSYETDLISSSTGNSFLSFKSTFDNLGLFNGEIVGPDITISSDNGHIIVYPDIKFPDGSIQTTAATSSSSANWSTNQAVSDVDFSGYVPYNLGALSVLGLINNTTYGSDFIESDSAQSHIYITPDANFGIQNGEPAGVGSDINFTSVNGNINLMPTIGGVGIGTTTPSTLLDIYGASMDVPPVARFTYNGYGTGDVYSGARWDNESGLNGILNATARGYTTVGVYTAGQLAFSSFQEGGIAFISRTLTEAPAGPIIFACGDYVTESARFIPSDESFTTSRFLVGSTNDDSTGSLIQSAVDISAGGSYWSQGVQGGNGFYVLDADGVTTHLVTGGLTGN